MTKPRQKSNNDLLKIAFCRAPVLSKDSWRPTSVMSVAMSAARLRMAESRISLGMADLSFFKRELVVSCVRF